MNHPIYLHQRPKPKSPRLEECPRCDDSENWPSGPEPPKCEQCQEDERVGIERMAEK